MENFMINRLRLESFKNSLKQVVLNEYGTGVVLTPDGTVAPPGSEFGGESYETKRRRREAEERQKRYTADQEAELIQQQQTIEQDPVERAREKRRRDRVDTDQAQIERRAQAEQDPEYRDMPRDQAERKIREKQLAEPPSQEEIKAVTPQVQKVEPPRTLGGDRNFKADPIGYYSGNRRPNERSSTGLDTAATDKLNDPVGLKALAQQMRESVQKYIREDQDQERDTRSLEKVASDMNLAANRPEKTFGYTTQPKKDTREDRFRRKLRQDLRVDPNYERNNTGISQGGQGPESDPAHSGDGDYGPAPVDGHDTRYNGPGLRNPNYNRGSNLSGVDETRPYVPPVNTDTQRRPQPGRNQPRDGGMSGGGGGRGRGRGRGGRGGGGGATAPQPETTPPAETQQQQKDRNIGRNGKPLSIRPDGTFNISDEAKAQADANREAIASAREQGNQSSRRQVGEFSVGVGSGGRPIITGGRIAGRYVNPNSPEGRIEASIRNRNEPDLPRDPTTGRLKSGQKMPWELEQEQRDAGEKAFKKSFDADLERLTGEKNATGNLHSDDIRARVRERIRREMERPTPNDEPTPEAEQTSDKSRRRSMRNRVV